MNDNANAKGGRCLLPLLIWMCCVVFAACSAMPPADSPVQIVPQDSPNITPVPSPSASSKGFVLDYTEVVFSAAGQMQIIYTGSVPFSDIAWHIDDARVASVINGVVTALDGGTATVTATYGDESISCIVDCQFTPVNTPAPTPAPPEDLYAPLLPPPSQDAVDASFFDDAVFVGDSVTLKLSYYAPSSGELGKAQFLVRGNYGVTNAVYDYLLMPYHGKEMNLQEAVAATGANKVFLMMGMNDIALYGIDKTMERWEILINRIREKSPGIQVYIQSMTPIYTDGQVGSLTNENTDRYNERLQSFAQANGYKYIDVNKYMKDGTGGLAEDYCSDSYVHVTDAGAAAWIRVLRAYTGY